MRAEVGKLMLDNVFHERANLNMAIVGQFLPSIFFIFLCKNRF